MRPLACASGSWPTALRVFRRRFADRRGQPRLPRLLRARLRPRCRGHQLRANLGDDITYSGTVSAAMEAVINNCRPSRSRRSTTSTRISRSPATRPRSWRATSSPRGCRGASSSTSSSPPCPSRSPGVSRSPALAGGSTRTSWSSDATRAASHFWIGGPPPSGLAVPGHRLSRGHQPADRYDTDPPGPYRPAVAAPTRDLAWDLPEGEAAPERAGSSMP